MADPKKYVINWTDDGLKDPFNIIEGSTNQTDSSLTLIGNGITEWGKDYQENFLHLVENFASINKPPLNPTIGQMWFNAADSTLKLYTADKTWVDLKRRRIDSSRAPHGHWVPGDLWFDTGKNQLKVYGTDGTWSYPMSGSVIKPPPISTPTPTPVTPTPVTPVTPTPLPPGVVPTPTPVPTLVPSPAIIEPPTPAGVFPFGQSPSLYPQITFNESFDGTSLDSNKWNTSLWYETDPGLNNYSVENGTLIAWPKQNNDGTWEEHNFLIDTDGKFYQKYGYFEARMKLPYGSAVWPAFWMYAHNDSTRPDISIINAWPGGVSTGYADANRHPKNYKASATSPNVDTIGERQLVGSLFNTLSTAPDLSADFHVYGARWDSTGIQFYFDGQALGSKLVTSEMNQMMYLLVDLWLGDKSGTPDANTPTTKDRGLVVDYVRAWALNDGTTQTGGTYSEVPTTPTPSVPTPVVPTPVSQAQPFGQSGAFTITFQDEFDGNSLNFTKWNDHLWYESSDPTINYKVENGSLFIWPANGFVNRTIDTDGKFQQTYGFFECEAKLPVGLGCWPAFWLYAHPSDSRPELDIMEAYSGGGPDTGWSDGNLHPNNFGATIHKANADYSYHEVPYAIKLRDFAPWKNTPVDLSAGFHKYGMKWDATGVTFYFDGQQIGTKWLDTSSYFNRPMYVLLDLWYGSASNTPTTDGTPKGQTNSFEVRYVRAWQFGGSAPVPTPTTPTPNVPTPTVPTVPTPTIVPTGPQFHVGMHAHRLYNNGGESGTPSPEPTFDYGIIRDWDIENLHDAKVWLSDGTINESLIEQVYKGHAANGAKVLKNFGSVPTWAAKRPTEPNGKYPAYVGSLSGPRNLDEYEDYCFRFINRFKDYLFAVEGWNEPYANNGTEFEFTTMTPTELADCQKRLYRAAKRVNPNMLVFSPPQAWLTGVPTILSAKTSQGEFMHQFFDVLSWHPYTYSANGEFGMLKLSDAVAQMKTYMKNAGISKPLADTEHGVISGHPGGTAFAAATATQKAQYMYDLLQAGKNLGLYTICLYGYDDGFVDGNVNFYSGPVPVKLQQAYLDLDTKWQVAPTAPTPTVPTPTFTPTPASPVPSGASQVRYIRNYISGNDKNAFNHWIEIQAFSNGTNVALGKTASVSAFNPEYSADASIITDGNTASDPYVNGNSGQQYAQVDLGQVYTISQVKIWHYYADSRTYIGARTDVSADGINWVTIHTGSYMETPSGLTINLGLSVPAPTPTAPTPVVPIPVTPTTPSPVPPAGTGPYGQDPTKFTLSFVADFDSGTTPNNIWTTDIWYKPNNSVKNYDVSGGALRIWPATNGGAFFDRTLVSQSSFAQKYGYFEVEAQLPVGGGLHPVISICAQDGPEIAIMHAYTGDPNGGWSTSSLHANDYVVVASLVPGDQYFADYRYKDYKSDHPDLSTGFHKFGVYWDQSVIKFYLDGVQWGPTTTNQINTPMWWYIGLWMTTNGTSASTSITPTGSTNSLKVNYAKAWTINSGSTGTPTPVSPTPTGIKVDYYGDETIWGFDGLVKARANNPAPKVFATNTGYTTSNEGVSASNSTQLINGTDGVHPSWSAQMFNSNATHVIINHAINDWQLDDVSYKSNLQQLISVARQYGKKPVLETPNPTFQILSGGSAVSDQEVANKAQYMREVGFITNTPVIDQFKFLTDYAAANGLQISQLIPDGIHPSQAVYTLKGNFAAGEFKKFFAGTSATPTPALAPTPVSPTPTTVAPVQAANRGYNRRVFWEDWLTPSTISTTGPWYVQRPFGYPNVPSSSYSVANSVLHYVGDGYSNYGISTAGPGSTGFRMSVNGGYFEARIRVLGRGDSNGCTSFWTMSLEHLYGGATNYVSIDFMKDSASTNGWTLTNLEQTVRNYASNVNNASDVHQTVLGSSFNFSDWHVYGLLWVPAASNGGNGYVAWYVDGVETARTNYTSGNYSLLDTHGLPIILGTGPNGTFECDWVAAWGPN